jgi:hypothetical protein
MMGKINYFFEVRDKRFRFRKFSSEQRDVDDADEDENTIYRGLAVPVDIRQVVEVRKSKTNLIFI